MSYQTIRDHGRYVDRIPVGSGGGGDPATSVTSETSFGISPVVGTSLYYARQDHTHGSPTNPVTDHATLATGVHGVSSGNIASDNLVSTSLKGLCPTLPNDDAKFLDGKGNWTVPASTGGGGRAMIFTMMGA